MLTAYLLYRRVRARVYVHCARVYVHCARVYVHCARVYVQCASVCVKTGSNEKTSALGDDIALSRLIAANQLRTLRDTRPKDEGPAGVTAPLRRLSRIV